MAMFGGLRDVASASNVVMHRYLRTDSNVPMRRGLSTCMGEGKRPRAALGGVHEAGRTWSVPSRSELKATPASKWAPCDLNATADPPQPILKPVSSFSAHLDMAALQGTFVAVRHEHDRAVTSEEERSSLALCKLSLRHKQYAGMSSKAKRSMAGLPAGGDIKHALHFH
ncbi:hypothetical protein S40285_10588 [Stachybotrys chlorohalonatus IBT 40285]|uniref:Uncharacterized protein n=1 Tax=Stachybotrys chlorohalonatus (strain IBT 40285) TaxID=1283841 RepID=A0A084QSX3_STAC4|nr:hypothetical protein S40285_10588 [Stachybotrys chlorohalonata IBT 40285]